MQTTKTRRFKTLETIWMWFVAIAFSVAGMAAFVCWLYGIGKFLKEVFNG